MGRLGHGARFGLAFGVGLVVLVVLVALAVGPAALLPRASHPRPRSPALTLTAVGDSVPSASGCSCAGYVQTLADLVAHRTGRAVTVRNDAVAGATTGGVVDALPGVAGADMSSSDLVVVQVGANDVDLDLLHDLSCQRSTREDCWKSDLQDLEAHLTRITQTAQGGPRHPLVLLVGYWNVTVDGAVADASGTAFTTASVRLTSAVNAVMARVARRTGTLYVDTRLSFHGSDGVRDPTDDLQEDGDHPDASGHELLARAIYDAAVASGRLDRWPRSP